MRVAIFLRSLAFVMSSPCCLISSLRRSREDFSLDPIEIEKHCLQRKRGQLCPLGIFRLDLCDLGLTLKKCPVIKSHAITSMILFKRRVIRILPK